LSETGRCSAWPEADKVAQALSTEPAKARVGLCVPATLIERMSRALAGSAVIVGGEDNQVPAEGAYTGDVSAEMLADAGARLVILGHSERRARYGETDELVANKVQAALRAGLEPIVCVGETLAEHQAGDTLKVIQRQVEGSLPPALKDRAFSLAYEPIWAIGTGLTPTSEQIEQAHAALRETLVQRLGETGRGAPILYGGSVKPSNAAGILRLSNVGGALVGGASLKAEDFLPIIRAAG
jgi:triosephosphate isomerase